MKGNFIYTENQLKGAQANNPEPHWTLVDCYEQIILVIIQDNKFNPKVILS